MAGEEHGWEIECAMQRELNCGVYLRKGEGRDTEINRQRERRGGAKRPRESCLDRKR